MRDKIVLFLRKKQDGLNSVEESAYLFASANSDIVIKTLPEYGNTFLGIIKNIVFAYKNRGIINQTFTDSYITIATNNTIVTVLDLGSFKNGRRFYLYPVSLFIHFILPSIFVKRFVCISNQTKDELVRLIPWRKKDISVIYQPISNKIKEVSSKNHTVPVILHIGTTPNKNLNKVIPALDGISCKLIIVGRLNEECLQLLKLHHIDYINKVDIPFSEIIKLYVECDIVTFPSSYEGQGLIVIEANATGRPVIAGDISVLHEVGGDSPYFVNPQNISEIRDAVLLILRNERLRNKKIRLGLENAKRFQVTEIMNQYKKIYQSVR